MGVKYVKVEGRRAECPCSVGTEKGILWEYVDDNYRHFQTLCGPCAEDLFGDINMFKLPVLTPEQITEIRPKSREEEECCEASPTEFDLLANLVRRVHSLEQQLKDTQGNVEKLSKEIAEANYVLNSPSPWATQEDVIELNGQIRRILAERTQPQSVEVVTFEKFLDSIADKVAVKLVGGR